MTAEDIYQSTLLLINSSREDSYYRGMFLQALSMLLEETYKFNNTLRLQAGKLAQSSVQPVEDFSSNVELEPYLAKTILPYGLAGILLYEDNPTKATIYRNRYDYRLSEVTFATYEPVYDVYGGGN